MDRCFRSRPNRETLILQVLTCALLCVGLGASTLSSADAAAAVDGRRYCFSDICPGDPPGVLSTMILNNLSQVAERPRARSKEYMAAFNSALPGLSNAERMALSAYTDTNDSLLLDARTLPIFRKIKLVCAPVGPFVALFTSESGHPTAVEFGAVMIGGEIRLGVTRVARSFQVKSGSIEEKALVADLSQKFGFRIDQTPEKRLSNLESAAIVESFERQETGFRIAFAQPGLRADAVEFSEKAGCGPAARIKIE